MSHQSLETHVASDEISGAPLELHAASPTFQGWEEEANYREPELKAHGGNPLIEALPSILDEREAARRLRNPIPYDPSERELPSHLRLQQLRVCTQFFVPLGRHIELEQRISATLRVGYLGRNPRTRGYLARMHILAEAAARSLPVPPIVDYQATGEGGSIIGVSGGGKTRSLERVLRLTPQVIQHAEYRGRPFTHRQLVWLKIACPFDGSIRGLCTRFFMHVDAVLGTRYEQQYDRLGRSAEQLMPAMARVAGLHSMGVFCIDEIQHLSEAASGGAKRMMNFFVELVNTLGIPIILVGTHKARSIVAGQFRSARRSCGLGGMSWPRLEEGSEDWQRFLKRLWTYQYLRRPADLTPEVSRALYYETQGVPDFVVKLFILAQMRAIAAKQEQLTTALIVSAAKDFLVLARPLLKALRENKASDLERYEDLEPPDLMAHFDGAQTAFDRERTAAALTSLDTEEGAISSSSADLLSQPTPAAHLASATPAAPITSNLALGGEPIIAPASLPPPAAPVRRRGRPKRIGPRPEPTSNSLRAIVLASPNISRYDALRTAGLVFSIEAYLSPAA